MDNTLTRVHPSSENLPGNQVPRELVTTQRDGSVYRITLNSPDTRNALGFAMFGALEGALSDAARLARQEEIDVVVLGSEGGAFCAGFDLAAGVETPGALAQFVVRLAEITRTIRSMNAIVVAKVQGAALAGGCAILASCDIVCACEGASMGYPVHRIGVSPAVSLPMLMASIGPGAARTLALSGEIIPALQAARIGLVHRVAPDETALELLVTQTVESLISKGRVALRETKTWLNQLDGTDERGAMGSQLAAATTLSADLCSGEESRRLLAEFWRRKAQR